MHFEREQWSGTDWYVWQCVLGSLSDLVKHPFLSTIWQFDPFLDVTSSMVKDPVDVLDRQICLDALAALRHAKWFQVRNIILLSSCSLMRCIPFYVHLSCLVFLFLNFKPQKLIFWEVKVVQGCSIWFGDYGSIFLIFFCILFLYIWSDLILKISILAYVIYS